MLLGAESEIQRVAGKLGMAFDPDVVDPANTDLSVYADRLYDLRQRKGVTRGEAADLLARETNYLGSVMVEMGDADAMLTGLTNHYPSALRPPLPVIGTAEDAEYVADVYLLSFKNRIVFCADTTVNQAPDADVLAEVTKHTAALARSFNVEPRARRCGRCSAPGPPPRPRSSGWTPHPHPMRSCSRRARSRPPPPPPPGTAVCSVH